MHRGGGRGEDIIKEIPRRGARTDGTRPGGSRTSWRSSGWPRAWTSFGTAREEKRKSLGPKENQRRRDDIIKEITKKVLAEERAPRPAGEARKSPGAAPAPAAPVPVRKAKPVTSPPLAATLVRPLVPILQADGALMLRVVKGLHSGALTPLTSYGVLMIGSAEDCEVILADPGVQSHHCLLSFQDGKLAVRAVDGAVMLGGQEHAPAASAVSLVPGTIVGLGEAEFEVTSNSTPSKAADPEPEEPAEDRQTLKHKLRGGWNWTARMLGSRPWAAGAAAGGAVAIACLLVVFTFVPRNRPMLVPSPVTMPEPSAVRSGDRIAQDVIEVLRLQGIAGEGTYTADGTVTVTGHLGDPHALEQAIRSRAIHEIPGLTNVIVVNLDHPGATTGTSADRARIVSAVSGNDPYVVTADGSRYYAGATLPQGGKLVGVQGDEILIERNGKTEHLKLSDVEAGAVRQPAAKGP